MTTSSEHAAVAREVLAELRRCCVTWEPTARVLGNVQAVEIINAVDALLGAAPPAPETVTVDWDGASCVLARNEKAGWNNKFGLESFCAGSFNAAMCDRIASDARGIRERDARIAELEELLRDQPRLLYDSAWQAIDRMGEAVGAMTGPGSNCHVTATRVCETIETLRTERDAALRALEEKGAGTLPKGASASEESQAAGSLREAPTSPAPIPLGAVVEVEGVEWTRTESGWDGGARWYHDGSTAARALTALYRARHPVATRETVERVRDAMKADCLNGWDSMARAALTAAGFTLEEGA